MTHSDFAAAVARIYREVIADAGPDGITRKAALDELVERIQPLVDAGRIVVDVDEAIRSAGLACDAADGKRADAVLRAAAHGQDSLDVDGDPVLDLVTVLGDGERKAWRHVTRADLMEMDGLRYRNMRAAADAYDRWRHDYDRWVPVLDRHATLGDAIAAGDLPDIEDPDD